MAKYTQLWLLNDICNAKLAEVPFKISTYVSLFLTETVFIFDYKIVDNTGKYLIWIGNVFG